MNNLTIQELSLAITKGIKKGVDAFNETLLFHHAKCPESIKFEIMVDDEAMVNNQGQNKITFELKIDPRISTFIVDTQDEEANE